MTGLKDYLKRNPSVGQSIGRVVWASNPQHHSSAVYHRVREKKNIHADHIHTSFLPEPGREIVSQVELIDLHGKRSIISKYVDGTVGQTYVLPGSGMEKLRDTFLKRMADSDLENFRKLREGTWVRDEEHTKVLHQAWQDMLLYGEALIESDNTGYRFVEQPPSDYGLPAPISREEAIQNATEIMRRQPIGLPPELIDETIDLYPQAQPTFSVARALRESAANAPKEAGITISGLGDSDANQRIQRVQRSLSGDERGNSGNKRRRNLGNKGRKARRV